MLSIDINDHGQATLAIADADGELHSYRYALVHGTLSLWAIDLTRTDTDASYRICERTPGRWTCDCPAETYRKRRSEHCKHVAAARAFRAWLRSNLESSHE